MSGERWVTETLHDGLRCAFRADEVIYEEETEHQHLVIFENVKFGRVMSLDGITQVTEKDEFVYHEMMSHVPILAHGNAKKVLIIGGGDGGVLREVLRHKTVEKCTMVEIDRSVVDMCVEYLPMISAGAFDDPRTDLVIADGAKFVAETDERYDVVIVDSTDPVGPGAILFSEEFYKNAKRCMAGGGIIVTQSIGRTNAFIRVYEASPSSATGPRAGFRRGFLWSRGTPVVAWRLLGDVKSAAWRAVNAPGPVLIRVDPYRPSQRPAVCLKSVQPDVR